MADGKRPEEGEMVFGLGKAGRRELTPRELEAMLRDGTALVVDVREAGEFAVGHIPGAINLPLSTFNASDLPDPAGRRVVVNCAAGIRSAIALKLCAGAAIAVDTQIAGGFGAWEAAGLPVER